MAKSEVGSSSNYMSSGGSGASGKLVQRFQNLTLCDSRLDYAMEDAVSEMSRRRHTETASVSAQSSNSEDLFLNLAKRSNSNDETSHADSYHSRIARARLMKNMPDIVSRSNTISSPRDHDSESAESARTTILNGKVRSVRPASTLAMIEGGAGRYETSPISPLMLSGRLKARYQSSLTHVSGSSTSGREAWRNHDVSRDMNHSHGFEGPNSAESAPNLKSPQLNYEWLDSSTRDSLQPRSAGSEKLHRPQESFSHRLIGTPGERVQESLMSNPASSSSTVWEELDEIKSRIHKLELSGKLSTSTNGVGCNTTILRSRETSKTDDASVHTPTIGSGFNDNVRQASHSLLFDALCRAKARLPSHVFASLEMTASDAIDLNGLITNGVNLCPSGTRCGEDCASGINISAVTYRRMRRKVESLCQSLTELAISMSDCRGGEMGKANRSWSSLNAYLEARNGISSRSSGSIHSKLARLSKIDCEGKTGRYRGMSIDTMTTTTTDTVHRITPSRALDRIEARRSSVLGGQSGVESPSLLASFSEPGTGVGVNGGGKLSKTYSEQTYADNVTGRGGGFDEFENGGNGVMSLKGQNSNERRTREKGDSTVLSSNIITTSGRTKRNEGSIYLQRQVGGEGISTGLSGRVPSRATIDISYKNGWRSATIDRKEVWHNNQGFKDMRNRPRSSIDEINGYEPLNRSEFSRLYSNHTGNGNNGFSTFKVDRARLSPDKLECNEAIVTNGTEEVITISSEADSGDKSEH